MAKKRHEVSAPKTGRRRDPLSERASRSKYPHKNLVGGKDVEGKQAGVSPIRTPSPFPKGSYETECWNDIIRTQSGTNPSWIYEQDYQYLYSHCVLWARFRRVQVQIDADIAENGGLFDGERVHPLVDKEIKLIESVIKSLAKLGLVPHKRMIIEAEEDGDDEEMTGLAN